MKKLVLGAFSLCSFGAAMAQNIIIDTVTTGAGYANHVWYSLENGTKTATPKSGWDIAFNTGGRSASIINNSAAKVWQHPTAPVANWATVDTAGLSGWDQLHNSRLDWESGAFNTGAGGGAMDYGWGEYNSSTHVVSGKAIFIIKLADQTTFKKFLVEKLEKGTYTFKYANLDGSSEVVDSLKTTDYSSKQFVHYSLVDEAIVDVEPASTAWDLLFTQYIDQVAMGADPIPYEVTGALSNQGVTVAEVKPVDAGTFVDYKSQTFDSAKNVIGYDWKAFTGGVYVIADSTVYFVTDKSSNIWKVVFTGFGGSADGNYIFSKEKLATTTIHDAKGIIASMVVYPNPAVNGSATVAYNLNESGSEVSLNIFSYTGQHIGSQKLNGALGMHTHTIATQSMAKGIYIISLNVNGQQTSQKLIVR